MLDTLCEVVQILVGNGTEQQESIQTQLGELRLMSRRMLDLRKEQPSILTQEDGSQVAYFQWCQLSMPISEYHELIGHGGL